MIRKSEHFRLHSYSCLYTVLTQRDISDNHTCIHFINFYSLYLWPMSSLSFINDLVMRTRITCNISNTLYWYFKQFSNLGLLNDIQHLKKYIYNNVFRFLNGAFKITPFILFIFKIQDTTLWQSYHTIACSMWV